MTRKLNPPGVRPRTEDERQRLIAELRYLRAEGVNPTRQEAIERTLRTQFDDGWPPVDGRRQGLNGAGA